MKLSEKLIQWTKNWFEENNRETAVIGISGGKDSAVVAAVCKEALGEKQVMGILMPNGEQADICDARQVAWELGIYSGVANIRPAYDAILRCVEEAIGRPASEGARINIAPRLRMMLLYAIAQTISEAEGAKACVVGTGNLAEKKVGYTTKWGDAASDVNPIGELWVDEVIQAGDELGYYPDVVHKAPADGLCGETDEDRMGFSYADVKKVFTAKEDVPVSILQKILRMNEASKHKRNPIASYQRESMETA